jgi:hypothetical protein
MLWSDAVELPEQFSRLVVREQFDFACVVECFQAQVRGS